MIFRITRLFVYLYLFKNKIEGMNRKTCINAFETNIYFLDALRHLHNHT